jgi:L,D-peptidoglycan transpeptidase YkuD (ErfK/YbiS/YcfS/YnhG family)
MTTDLQDKQATPDSDANSPGQQFYDREFANIIDPEHLKEDGVSGDTGQTNPDEGLYNPKGDAVGASGLKGLETGERGLAPSLMGGGAGNAASGAAAGLLKGGVAGGVMKLVGRITSNKRKSAVTGGVGGIVIGGIFLIATIASGPGQLIRYGQLLANISPFHHQQSSTTTEMDKLMRWAKSSDIGETRLTRLGSITNRRVQADLAKVGTKITTDPITGQMSTITIDTSQNPKYSDLSPEDAKIQIAADNGVPVDSIHQISNLNGRPKYAFSTKGLDTAARRGVIGGLVDDQNLGPLTSWNRFRTLTRYYNENSWLHPLKKLSKAADQRLADKLRTKAAAADEDSRLKKLAAKSESVKDFNKNIRSKISPGAYKAVGGALIATAGICIAKDIVHSVPEVNRLNVIEPAMVSAGDALALGSQIESGQDVDLDQVGAAVTNLTDSKGTTPWQSAGIQRLDGNDTGGIAADTGVSQAFSSDSSESSIEKDLNALGADALCSTLGQIAQGVAGVAILVTGAGGLVEKGVQVATSFAISAAIGQLTQNITKVIADDPLTGVPHQGAAGGNVDALGDLALANSNAVAMGGTQLSPAETAELDSSEPANQDFNSQSFASRVFNTNDYRSVASQFLDSQNPKVTQNVTNTMASMFTGFMHIGSTFSSLAGMLFPKVHAQPTTPYGLGIPEYGFSRADLDNPLFEDPYANADAAAALFNNDAANQYIEKAKTCFGVTISKDASGDWGAVGSNDVNTASTDYTGASCSDSSTDWKRVRFFILDTGTMEGYACSELDDDQSCTDSGWGSSSTSSSSASSTTTVAANATNLPVNQPVADAQQVITVSAPSVSSTTATLQAWDKSGTTWVAHGAAIPANVGSQGITSTPSESLSATPIGSFTLTQTFGTKANPGTTLDYFKTSAKDWWNENPSSPAYNQHVVQSISPGGNSEQLSTIVPQYDYAIVINANTSPVVAGAGSGFFIHVSTGVPTAGCVSIPEADLVSLMQWLKLANKPRVLIGTAVGS